MRAREEEVSVDIPKELFPGGGGDAIAFSGRGQSNRCGGVGGTTLVFQINVAVFMITLVKTTSPPFLDVPTATPPYIRLQSRSLPGINITHRTAHVR